MNIFYFYTNWSMVLHLLYYFGIVPNTYYISLLTLIGSLYLNYGPPQWMKNIKNKFWIVYDIIFHILPFVILYPIRNKANIGIFIISIIIYLFIFGNKIKNIYFSKETPITITRWFNRFFY